MYTFLATPITFVLRDPADHRRRSHCNDVRRLLDVLRTHPDDRVFCALEAESWGLHVPGPAELVRRDESELRRADLLVVYYPESVVSSVILEIGWADALNKSIIVCRRTGVALPVLVDGLVELGDAKLIEFDDIEALLPRLAEAVDAQRERCGG